MPPTIRDVTSTALSPMSSAVDGLTASIGKLQAVSNTATASISTLTSAIQSQVARFVGLYSPAEVIKFERAVADLNATIGRALLPLLQRFTLIVREIGNAIAGLSPAGNKMIAVMAAVGVGLATATVATGVFFATMSGAIVGLTLLAGALGTATAIATAGISLLVGAAVGLLAALTAGSAAMGLVGSEFESLKDTVRRYLEIAQSAFESISRRFEDLMTVLKPLSDALADLEIAHLEAAATATIVLMDAMILQLQIMEPVLTLAVAGIKRMTDSVRGLIETVRFIMGIETGSRRGDSEGMAIRNTRFGSPDDLWREAVKNSFSLGAAKDDPARETVNHLLSIRQILERLEIVLSAATGIPVHVLGGTVRVVGETGAGSVSLARLALQRQLHD